MVGSPVVASLLLMVVSFCCSELVLFVCVVVLVVVVVVVGFDGVEEAPAAAKSVEVEEEDKTHLNDDGVEMYSVE